MVDPFLTKKLDTAGPWCETGFDWTNDLTLKLPQIPTPNVSMSVALGPPVAGFLIYNAVNGLLNLFYIFYGGQTLGSIADLTNNAARVAK